MGTFVERKQEYYKWELEKFLAFLSLDTLFKIVACFKLQASGKLEKFSK